MAPFIITGSGSGGSAPRYEINAFVKNEKHFSLYIQALQEIFSKPQGELLSFFQIGGIHGKPYIEWNESPIVNDGYCVHATPLFPTWHRPYVALFEQILHQHAIAIAAKYEVDKAGWTKAAVDLRQPFWDWASNTIPPDEVISLENVTITKAPGVVASVKNPFLQYRFHPVDPSFGIPYSQWQDTLRHPTPPGSPQAVTNVPALKARLAAAQATIKENTLRLFSITTWAEFSNKSPSPGGSTSSLESVHDSIHVAVGGGGHMGSIAVAGFDPIFYLHHCQVDRLIALWSAIHTGVWVPGEDAKKNLTPFWNSGTTYWSSASIRTTDALNYSYALTLVGADAVEIAQNVKDLYGAPAYEKLFSRASETTGQGIQKAVAQGASESTAHNPTEPSQSAHNAVTVTSGSGPSNTLPEWTARIRCNPYDVGTSFSVVLFFGEVPDDSAQWFTSSRFVGTFDAFVNDDPEECANCRNQAGHDIEGYVHLNTAVLRHSGQETLDPTAVLPYLENNLRWGVQKADGTVVELSSLEVVVIATPLSLPVGAHFPIAGEPHHYHNVTRGRRGGSRAA